MAKTPKRPGRPASGLRQGEQVQNYPRFTLRIPSDVRAWLNAASFVLEVPQWRVVIDAVLAYVGVGDALPESTLRAIRQARRAQDADSRKDD